MVCVLVPPLKPHTWNFFLPWDSPQFLPSGSCSLLEMILLEREQGLPSQGTPVYLNGGPSLPPQASHPTGPWESGGVVLRN